MRFIEGGDHLGIHDHEFIDNEVRDQRADIVLPEEDREPLPLPGQLSSAAASVPDLRHASGAQHIIAHRRGGPPRPENTGGATPGLPANSPAPSLCHPIRAISEIRG